MVSQVETGDLIAFYDFESGDGDYIYNQLYTPADHFVGSAINTDKLPALSVGETDWPITGSGYFSETDLVKVGLKLSQENWSMAMDINPDLCTYRDQQNVSRVLASTMDSPNSTSGFHVGINQSNRLYIQYNKDQNVHVATLPQEINNHSVVGIEQADTSVSVSYYDLNIKSIYSITTSSDEVSGSDYLYLGNFASNSDPLYTGYKGYIKHASLFSGNFGKEDINSYCSCMFSEGTTTTTTTVTDTAVNITGSIQTPIYETRVTGFVNVTSQMTQENGENISIFFKSGVTGLVEVGKETSFLTGAPTGSGHNVITTGIDYDKEKQKLYNRYFLNFRDSLVSGEKIEIHIFENPQYDVGLIPDPGELLSLSGQKIRLYYRGAFQQASGDKTFLSDHSFDYYVEPSGGKFHLKGITSEDSYLTYDLINTGTVCIDFSGHWGNHCSQVNLNTQSGCEYMGKTWVTENVSYYDPEIHSRTDLNTSPYASTWYPEGAQFIETGDNTVTITGVSGENGFVSFHDRDIYLNGQKLIYGKGYQTGIHIGLDFCSDDTYTSQSTCEAAGWCSNPQYFTEATCVAPDVWTPETWNIGFNGPAIILYAPIAGWGNESTVGNMPTDIFNPELCFVPKTTGETPNILVYDLDLAPNTTVAGISDPLSGFSELIWLNGLRQQKTLDYRRGLECSLTKSFTIFEETPLIFYNNGIDVLNME